MKSIAVLALTLTLSAAAFEPRLANAQAPATAPASCAPSGDLSFVCGLVNVEDFLPVNGGRWLVAGSYQASPVGLYLIDTAAKKAKPVALSIAAKPDPIYAGCAAPDPKGLATHGLEVIPGEGGISTVLVINHTGRESVEAFRLNPAKGSAEWVGCVVLPARASGNSLAALPKGAFVVSKFLDTEDKEGIQHVLSGAINGVVYLWTPGKGFSEVPGTQLSGDNGLAVSRDGKWLYVNAWGSQEIYRVPLSGKGERSSVKVDFRPDNLRWGPDGKLLATGQFLSPQTLQGRHGWATARLDPEKMTITTVVKEAGLAVFDDATTGVQVGNTFWFGTYKGDRVAYRAAP